jgi:hypothetical protein
MPILTPCADGRHRQQQAAGSQRPRQQSRISFSSPDFLGYVRRHNIL